MTDLKCRVGTVELGNPIMTASGTSGHGAELSTYGPISELGAIVVKSVAPFACEGNPPLRVVPVKSGMLNSVGLTGPGISNWIRDYLPNLKAARANVVVSIWGKSVDDYRKGAQLLCDVVSDLVALEVNVSCPNGDDPGHMFAQSAHATGEIVSAVTSEILLPVWVKLTPMVADIVEIAKAAAESGAQALTLINTMAGMSINIDERAPALGGVTGGLSGPALHPIAVRAVYECRRALPHVGIVGAGGVATALDAIELMMAGADAVQVGTASFVDPRAPWKIKDELVEWCALNRISKISELRSAAHRDLIG